MNRGADEPLSKTRRKRDAEALQQLGEELAGLPDDALDRLGLPERLRDALEALRQMSSHGALRRQRQYVGRLMREVDPEPLRAALQAHMQPSRDSARRFRETESWRDRLVAEGPAALDAFLAEHPGADRSALAEALAAVLQGRAGAARRLFRMLREASDQAGNAPAAG